jgi:hypothetical protein
VRPMRQVKITEKIHTITNEPGETIKTGETSETRKTSETSETS